MGILKVEQTKCTKCGICAEVCPGGIIRIAEKGPKLLSDKGCLSCGHCVAVCPNEALDNEKTPLSKQVDINKFPIVDAQTAAMLLRSRRSIRTYKKEPITRKILLQLLDIARFAPSGGNTQGVSYIAIENSEVLQKIISATVDWMEEQIKNGVAWAGSYSGIVSFYRKTGKDVILRGAPNLLVAVTPKDFPIGRDNSRFALTYVDIFATTLGLGTCWAGFVEMCASAKYAPLLELMDVPKDKVVTGAMMVGYPKYTYKRLVDRNPLNISWV